jgi:hypothetical protein
MASDKRPTWDSLEAVILAVLIALVEDEGGSQEGNKDQPADDACGKGAGHELPASALD